MTLTGRTRYRTSWRGKIILQVEEATPEPGRNVLDRMLVLWWRDAKLSDLQVAFARKEPQS